MDYSHPRLVGYPFLTVVFILVCVGCVIWLIFRENLFLFLTYTGRPRAPERENAPAPASPVSFSLTPYGTHDFTYDQGLRYEKLKEYRSASALFLQVIRVTPEWAEPRYRLALSFARMKDHDNAWEQYRELRVLDPELARKLYRELAEFHL